MREKRWIVPHKSFPASSAGKDYTCNAGDPGLIPRSGRFAGEGVGSWGRNGVNLIQHREKGEIIE